MYFKMSNLKNRPVSRPFIKSVIVPVMGNDTFLYSQEIKK